MPKHAVDREIPVDRGPRSGHVTRAVRTTTQVFRYRIRRARSKPRSFRSRSFRLAKTAFFVPRGTHTAPVVKERCIGKFCGHFLPKSVLN